jgi:hypothetical protein
VGFVVDKRHVRKNIKQLQRIKTWQLLVLLVLMGFVSATFLRLNNIGMVQRRDAVLAADKTGDQTALTQRMYDLQRYTSAHMNASTGPFYLEYQYQRDAQAAVDAASGDNSLNGNVHVKAEAVCRPQFSVWSPAYVQCFTDELAKYPPSPDPAENVQLPSADLYHRNFASPAWSADFAGWSIAVCALIILLIIVRLIGLGILRLMLKQHYRGI